MAITPADLFGSVTNRKVVQEEIRAQGISGYYYLSQNNLVTGSEKVRIEVRDRFHSEIVISRKEKSRYSDYDVDYPQGTLYFKQPVPEPGSPEQSCVHRRLVRSNDVLREQCRGRRCR